MSLASELQKAKQKINKVARPAARRGSKAVIGVGKVASSMGYKGTGRKISNHGRAGLAASKIRD